MSIKKNIVKSRVGIIGMGPAGITAGIYLKRFNFEPICFEKGNIGGKVNVTSEIDNYPGFTGTVSELLNNFQKQIDTYKLDVRKETVESVSYDEKNKIFSVTTDKTFYEFESVLLASGLKEREYEVPNQKKYDKRGISRCAVCDGPFFRNRIVCVIGGGNSAFEEAIYLAGLAKKVYLVNRRGEFRADSKLVDEFKSFDNTEILVPYTIADSDGDTKIRHLTLEHVENKSKLELDIDGLFIYVGSSPVSEFIKIENLVNPRGFISTNNLMETSVPGFFVAGDCRDTPLRQIVTATNDGAIASISIKKFLKEKDGK